MGDYWNRCNDCKHSAVNENEQPCLSCIINLDTKTLTNFQLKSGKESGSDKQ